MLNPDRSCRCGTTFRRGSPTARCSPRHFLSEKFLKPWPESGRVCPMCFEFARQRLKPQRSTPMMNAGVEPHFGAALRRRDAHHARRAPLRRGAPGIITPAPTTNSPTTPPCTHWKSHTDKLCILHPIPCTPYSALYWKHYTTPFTRNPVLRNPTYTLHSLLHTLTPDP